MNYFDYMADRARACAIVAHRGVWKDAPENSLLSIERAIAAGYDVVEIDVRRSVDGEFFLLHDDTLTRMAGLDREPETMTLAELNALRLRYRGGGVGNPFTEEQLPSLRDAFALTRDRIFIHLDVKHREMIPQVIAFAREMGVDKQVDFWSNLSTEADLDWVMKEVVPNEVPFIAKTRLEGPDADRQLDLVFRLKPFVCEITFNDLAQVTGIQDRFHREGIALWANTLDTVTCAGFTDTAAIRDPEAIWGRLIDAGISAIQTDEMAALRALIEKRNGAPRRVKCAASC